MKKTDKTYTAPTAEIVELQTQTHILVGSAGNSTTGFTATGARLTGGSGIDDEF